MQDLTPVGLSEDRSRLILVSDSGEEFWVTVDAKLQAALGGDQARLGQLEIQMESALRPRDIQARIRSGETPETVAAAAQTTVDRIMAFAMPVLAERAHVAERAQRAAVRRRAGEGQAGLLGDAVAERLRARNVDPNSVTWDAWRREDGRWTLVADYRSGESERHAEFTYDTAGRYVVANDDEGRWLIGERTASHGPQPRATATPAGPRRLAAVTADNELPLGDDAIELVSEPSRESGPAAADTTVDLTETAAAARAALSAQGLPVETADADWIVTQATERPATQEPPAAEAPQDAEDAEGAESTESTGAGETGEQTGATEEPAATAKPGRKGRGRASVPSWDEIMFGSGRAD